jgi:hypothetical protein
MITMNLVHFERSVDALVRSGILGVALRQRRGCRSFGQ